MPGRQFPKVEAMLRDAADDITAYASFPVSHWKKICPSRSSGRTTGATQPRSRRRRTSLWRRPSTTRPAGARIALP
jgi:hypothetical protein